MAAPMRCLPLQPEVAPLYLRHPTVVVVPNQSFDLVLDQPVTQGAERAGCRRVGSREVVSLQHMDFTLVLVALDLRPQQFVGAVVWKNVLIGYRLAMPTILGTVAHRHPTNRLTGILIGSKTLEIWRRHVSGPQFASLVELAVAHEATSTVILASRDSFAIADPLAAGDPLGDHERWLFAEVANENGRYLVHVFSGCSNALCAPFSNLRRSNTRSRLSVIPPIPSSGNIGLWQ